MVASHVTSSIPLQASGASLSPNTAKGDSAAIRKLRKAAGEFEAILLEKWWSSMKKGGLSGDEQDSDPGKDTLEEMGLQAMCAAVEKGGGIGIAAMLVRSLLSNARKESTGSEVLGQPEGISSRH